MSGLSATTPLFARNIMIEGPGEGRGVDFVPAPRLLSPTKETVDLTNKDSLEFKWSPHEGDRMKRRSYDFRLYKGYEMLESSLVTKKFVPADTFSVRLKQDLFKDGETYTWSVRQIYYGSQKSRRSIQSFKVINRVPEKPLTEDQEEEEKKNNSHTSRYINGPR